MREQQHSNSIMGACLLIDRGAHFDYYPRGCQERVARQAVADRAVVVSEKGKARAPKPYIVERIAGRMSYQRNVSRKGAVICVQRRVVFAGGAE